MTPLLALLLHCCPRAFREAYGADIRELFAIRRARLQGSPRAVFALWLRTILDVSRTAAAEWTDVLRSRGDRAPQARRRSMSDRLTLDLRDAVRRLVRTPGFSIAALLILAIGIGSSAAIFSVVDAFALRALPYERPHELVWIYQDSDDGVPSSNAYPAYLDIAEHSTLFASVGAVIAEGDGTLLTAAGDAETVPLEFATSTFFPTLGLRPAIGRWFTAIEDEPGAPAVAVVTHIAWRRRFGSDPAVLGRTIRISGSPVTIVGVGPADYNGFKPGLASEFWLSISSLGPVGGAFRERTLTRREDHWFQVVARLAPGRTVQDAQSAMTRLADRFGREFPETDRNRRITVLPSSRVRTHPEIDAAIYPAAGMNILLAGLLLALVCSNLANLTLARASARTRELAVRLAIGATRGQVVRSLTIESLVLALAGGALGLLLARLTLRLLAGLSLPPPFFAPATMTVDTRVIAFGLAVSLLAGLAFGLLPAMRTTRSGLRASLTPPVSLHSLRPGSLRGLLIALQVAISVALLAGSGILLRSMTNAVRTNPGFAPGQIAVVALDAGQGRPAADGLRILEDLLARVSMLPGVDGAALTTRPPVTPFGPSNTLVLDEHAAADSVGSRTVEVRSASVTPAYFAALGIPLLHGRAFTDADRDGGAPVSIVSAAMARRHWGSADVVGRRYRHEGQDTWITIVGVTGDVTIETPGEAPRAFLYRPFAQAGFTRAALVARGDRDPAALLPLIRQEIRAIDTQIPITVAATMSDHIARSLAVQRAAAAVLSTSGVLAIVLACLGVYAVVAFSVAKRRTEMGVRMALGATGPQITRLVVRETMTLVAVGLAAGLLLAALITPGLGSLLVGVQPQDPLTFGAVTALVAAVALVTTWIPARRAARADPAAVLRVE